mmetsp:Transcript_63502/g.178713  ORF Transcript_63502/g.178713 Transcript_63502/m.178713 type:complete len:260 (-) Transcript_63502:126-905(-)
MPMHTALKALDAVGLCGCAPDRVKPRILRLTFLKATNIRSKSRFYFEAWCDPGEGYPKISRVHVPVTGSVDLGFEQVDLDWFGDARTVFVHAVEYTNAKQSTDKSLAELQVSRADAEAIAGETRQSTGDIRLGTRVFEMAAVTKKSAVARRKRFQSLIIPEWLCLRLMAGQGTMMQSRHGWDQEDDDLSRLREENMQLRRQTGNADAGKPRVRENGICQEEDALTRPRAGACAMNVVIHFEFLSKDGGAEVDLEQIQTS